MRIAVIIPHLDDQVRLGRCLDALAPRIDAETEVVVVDNGSARDVAGVAGRPGVRLVHEPRKGAAHARNRGVAETVAPVLAFLDCDCVPAPDWLTRARTAPRPGEIVGGAVPVFCETPGPRSGAEAFETVFAFRQAEYIATKGFSVTANLVTTRAVWDRVGPFRDGLSEDVDWCHRARALGIGLRHDPALIAAHPARADWPALRRKWRRMVREGHTLSAERPGGAWRWALRGLLLPVSILRDLPRIVAAPGLSGGERLRAAATLVRLRLLRAGWMAAQLLGRGP